MDKAIKKLENCLKAMKKCLKVPRVENCICFSDAFKVLDAEAGKLLININQIADLKDKEKLTSIKKEIEKIKSNIPQGDKECIGCNPCIASVVFKAYPDTLNSLYLNNNL